MQTDTEKKKIVLLIRNAAKSDFGGAETYQVSLARTLIDNGFKPIVITRSQKLLNYAMSNHIDTYRGWWWSRQNWSGYRTVFLPVYLAWQALLTSWYLYLILKTHASILHIQSKDDFIAGSLAGRLLNKRVIWTDHMDLRYVFENIARPFRNPVGKLVFWAARFANHIILISKNEHQLVTSHFRHVDSLKQRIIIVKNGVIDRYNDILKEEGKHIFTFCIASRIVTNKGIGEAIQAFLKLEKRIKPNSARLVIYGDGPERKKFEEMAHDSKSIMFYGHQNNVIEKIADSDVFMLPSYQEGFSIALLEATMLGKAIIATNIDSNPEIIRHMKSGLLIPPRDTDLLEQAMFQMLTKIKLKSSMATQARKDFERSFNLHVITKNKIIPLYNDRSRG